MFSFFKKKEQKPFHRFEIRQDGNGEFLVKANSTDDEFAYMGAHIWFNNKRFANVYQAEKGIDAFLKAEAYTENKYNTKFVKTYP